jgi:hypothetical protein
VGRIYREDLYDLPSVPTPDWDLLARLEELAKPHIPVYTNGGPSIWFAEDNRGQYDAPNLDVFRREAEAQEEMPETVRLSVRNGWADTEHYINVYASSTIGSGGTIQSTDEAFVNHVSARIRDLFSISARQMPSGAPVQGPERPDSGSASGLLALVKANLPALIITIVATVIGGVIVALLVGG